MIEYDEFSDRFKKAVERTQKHIESSKDTKNKNSVEDKEYLVYLVLNIEFFKEYLSGISNYDKLDKLNKYINDHSDFKPLTIYKRSSSVRSFLAKNGIFSSEDFKYVDMFLSSIVALVFVIGLSLFFTINMFFLFVIYLIVTFFLAMFVPLFCTVNFYIVKSTDE